MGWLIDILPSILIWAITGGLGAFCVWVCRRLKAQRGEQEAIREGLQVIMHDMILIA